MREKLEIASIADSEANNKQREPIVASFDDDSSVVDIAEIPFARIQRGKAKQKEEDDDLDDPFENVVGNNSKPLDVQRHEEIGNRNAMDAKLTTGEQTEHQVDCAAAAAAGSDD